MSSQYTNGKAYLAFPNAKNARDRVTYVVKITELTRGINAQLQSSITRNAVHYYPIRTKEADLAFTIQCRSQSRYDDIRSAAKEAQQRAISEGPPYGFAQLIYPDLNYDFLGFITNVTSGRRRFEFAPTLSFSMVLVRDAINDITNGGSSLNGDWKGIVGNSLVDMGRAKFDGSIDNSSTPGDDVLGINPPTMKPPRKVTGSGGGKPQAAQ